MHSDFFTSPEQGYSMNFSFASKNASLQGLYILLLDMPLFWLFFFFPCKKVFLSGMHCLPTEIMFTKNL